MKPVMRAWLRGAARLHRRRESHGPLPQHRKELVRRYAPGKSFIDVGGMFNLTGDIAFFAEEIGATEVVLLDVEGPIDEFVQKHRARDSHVKYLHGDLHDPATAADAGEFDVVWCSGVFYHSPNPMLQLEHLRAMTAGDGLLVLTGHIIPEVPGFEQACLFYPRHSIAAQQEFALAHGDDAPHLLGASADFDYRPGWGFVNFWWGITPSALRAMLYIAGFDIQAEYRYSPFLMAIVAKAAARESVTPPLLFLRESGRRARAEFDPAERPLGEFWIDRRVPVPKRL